jgi:hypothetical protein
MSRRRKLFIAGAAGRAGTAFGEVLGTALRGLPCAEGLLPPDRELQRQGRARQDLRARTVPLVQPQRPCAAHLAVH